MTGLRVPRSPPRPGPHHWLLLGAVLAVAEVPLALASRQAPGVVGRGHDLLLDIGVWWLLGAAAVLCLLRAPTRPALAVGLGVGVVLRLVMIGPMGPLSDDYYRYAWDGRVQAAGTDPYRYAPLEVPGQPRDTWLFPDVARCTELHRALVEVEKPLRPHCTLLNRPAAPTIYPPVAQGWFWLLHVTGLTRLHDAGLQTAGLLLDLAVLAALLALLRGSGQDRRWVVAWALAPLPALEAVADGHVDALGVLLVLGAVALSRRHRPVAGAGVLALAALVKLYPALLLPALVRGRPRVLLAAGAVFTGVVALGYLPHVLVVGTRVVGSLPMYLGEENYSSGGRFLLLGVLGLTGAWAGAVAVAVLGGLAALVAVRRPDPALAATWLYGAFLLLDTPVQTWYALALGAVAVAAARPEWLLVAAAGYPLYVLTVLAEPAVMAGRISYGAAGLVVLAVSVARAAARGRTPVPRRQSPPGPHTPAAPSPAARMP